jgi:hypothetical protein
MCHDEEGLHDLASWEGGGAVRGGLREEVDRLYYDGTNLTAQEGVCE